MHPQRSHLPEAVCHAGCRDQLARLQTDKRGHPYPHTQAT